MAVTVFESKSLSRVRTLAPLSTEVFLVKKAVVQSPHVSASN